MPGHRELYAWAGNLPLDRKIVQSKPGRSTASKLAHAQNKVTEWESKVKRAENALKKWNKKVSYYQKKETVNG